MHPIQTKLIRLLDLPTRLVDVATWYLISLMLPAQKHTLSFAEQVSGKSRAQFSRFLAGSVELAQKTLQVLGMRIASELASSRSLLLPGSPWAVAILIDSTLQKRSSRRSGNVHKFNHGHGYMIGHQWTNILLLINGQYVPLPPIAFLSQKERRRRGLAKETEQDAVIRYLKELDLSQYIGPHSASEILVLQDAGYDNKKLQSMIVDRGWDFVGALKASRGARTYCEAQQGISKGRRIDELFRACRRFSQWTSVRCTAIRGSKRKRKEFRARELIGFLGGVSKEIKLVLSEERGSRCGRKYIACSNVNVTVGVVVRAYRLRWGIEIFHKEVKSYLGFEDVSCCDFVSVEAHVHWVYVAHLMHSKITGESSITASQKAVETSLRVSPLRRIRHMLGRFQGKDEVSSYCLQVIQGENAA